MRSRGSPSGIEPCSIARARNVAQANSRSRDPLPDGLARLLLSRRLALAGEQTLLGDQHAVALDVAVTQPEAVEQDRHQRIQVHRMLARQLIEARVKALDRLIHDHEQAVLL